MKLTVPTRQILTDGVYESVKELVMDQRIPPGSRVNIDRLARDLGVSPTPVREVLARLESDGLVIKEPLRGYSIAPVLSTSAFEELYDMRLLLEPFAARRACERSGPRLARALKRVIDEMRATHAGINKESQGHLYRQYRRFALQDEAFHALLTEAAGNQLLRETLSRLRAHLHLYRLYYNTGVGAETIAEHERIELAIRAGNADHAAAAMTEHIQQSRLRLSRGWDETTH
jgi:DNA-binding GntR family transcriptional regulator